MDVPVFNMQGAQVGQMTIDESSLGGKVNPALIKQAYVRYHANTRQGSARTKNREAVEDLIGFPAIVKPSRQGSSVGLFVVSSIEEGRSALVFTSSRAA